eukprot:COSAG06_NODE_9055_length_2001_cov_3.399579_2_plen_173_part_01
MASTGKVAFSPTPAEVRASTPEEALTPARRPDRGGYADSPQTHLSDATPDRSLLLVELQQEDEDVAAVKPEPGQRYEAFMDKLSAAAGKGFQQRFFVLEDGMLSYYTHKDARAVFDEVDADGSGSLDRDEVGELCKTMGKALSQKGIDKAMADMDEDESGLISFDEFEPWWLA